MLRTDASQVVTVDVNNNPSSARWLGTLGHISALKYSFTCPGGADQMSCTLQRSSRYRTDALRPGRLVKVIRGASVVWRGKLDEPDGSGGSWQITAHGSGTYGGDFMAVYDTWASNPDQSIDNAIARGMRWRNPGIGHPAGMWLGQRVDPGSQSISDLLNLVCTRGGLTWYVKVTPEGSVLSVFPLPTTPRRILVSTSPVARTLGGDINRIWIRYQDPTPLLYPQAGQGTIVRIKPGPHYKTTSIADNASIAVHGPMETYDDLSSGGKMAAVTAQGVGQHILDRYKRASYAGPFIVGPGDYLNNGGVPVDLGCEQAATVCRVILTDNSFGGEITPAPISFLIGAYEYDDDSMSAAITPFQALRSDFAGLLGEVSSTFLLNRQRLEARRRKEARRDRRRAHRIPKHPHRRRDHFHGS
jgi:hypothetical protein